MTATSTRTRWPSTSDLAAWGDLANRAMQLETLDVDLAENEAWAATMRALIAQDLGYDDFTALRLQALSVRVRRRKLDQTNLRYKYGIKARTARLVRSDVEAYLGARAR